MYATVGDVRAEGVTEQQASDERVTWLLDEAAHLIDRATGWFFRPRQLTLRLDGRGTPTVEPPVPPISIDQLRVGRTPRSVEPDDLVVVGAPVEPGFHAPRLTLRRGVFPRGQANVEVFGRWGLTEPDGTLLGRTPLAIRRACLLLVLRWLAPLADPSSTDARTRWRLVEERTRDQSYRLDAAGPAGPFTGDPELDRILALYRKPAGLGAA